MFIAMIFPPSNMQLLKAARFGLIAILALLPGCMTPYDSKRAEATRAENNVRSMAASVSRDLAKDGPNAWLRHFEETPNFFMAVNGKLQFTNFTDAKAFLPGFSMGVSHMELTWSDIRVDPVSKGTVMMGADYKEVFTDKAGHNTEFHGYFTGLAVETSAGWKLRDAHWSAAPASP